MPDLFKVGDHIRCYDFAHSDEFYLEGEVVEVDVPQQVYFLSCTHAVRAGIADPEAIGAEFGASFIGSDVSDLQSSRPRLIKVPRKSTN